MRRAGLGRPPGGAGRRRNRFIPLIRAATPGDATAAAELVLETPGGLLDLLGDRAAALRIARATFLSPRSAFGYPRTLVADEGGHVVGQIIRITGWEWRDVRTRTGLVMTRAAGLRAGFRLIWRGLVEARLIPSVPADALYVPSLSVAPSRRGQGIGWALLDRVIEEARVRGLRAVGLDVASRNDGAIRFYRRHGFVRVEERRAPAMRGLPTTGSIRMELSI